MTGPDETVVCPSCGAAHEPDLRFCPDCGLPLAFPVEHEVSARHARARKIKPQYAEGELVQVARANHQAEAELIQGILLEEGVPSMTRRSRGFDVPALLAAGPRDVMVPASGAQAAREALLAAEMITERDLEAAGTPPVHLFAALLVAIAIVAIILWLGTTVFG
jgi:hypothetical protein